MRNSFICESNDLLKRANQGQDPLWFEFVDASNARTSFAVVHIDTTHFATKRLVILHFSSIKREDFGNNLDELVTYIWKNLDCDEIKFTLYHMEDEDFHMGPDVELQDVIKKKGFRWKQLTNDKLTGKRYIVYLIKRPEDMPNTQAKQ